MASAPGGKSTVARVVEKEGNLEGKIWIARHLATPRFAFTNHPLFWS